MALGVFAEWQATFSPFTAFMRPALWKRRSIDDRPNWWVHELLLAS